jgi:hypothetical protein
MPVFTCTYSDRSKTAEIEAKNFEEAAEEFARKYPSQVKLIDIKNFVRGRKTLPNPGAEDFRKKAISDGAKKQKAKEEALDHIVQKIIKGDAERLNYDEINMVVENFFAHDESFREQEADLRRRLYAQTLTNSTLQGLIQTTILTRLISNNSSKGNGTTGGGGNSMGKALVAASLLNNQQLRGMAEDVEDISEGFGFDEE